MAARRPSKNPELMLQANDVGVTDVQEVRRPLVGRQILLLDLESDYLRIFVAALDVIDRNCEALSLRVRRREG